MSSSQRDSGKNIADTSSKAASHIFEASKTPRIPQRMHWLTRTLARSAVSMLVLAGLLSGQVKAAGHDEMAEELGSPAVASQTVASAPAGFVDNLMNFSQKLNMRGAQTVSDGFVELGKALGHMTKGVWSQNAAADCFLDGMDENQNLAGKGTSVLDGGYEVTKTFGHFGAAGMKSLQGLSKIAQGQLQLAYDNPKYAGLLAGGIVGGLVAYDVALGTGELVKQLGANLEGVKRGFTALKLTVGQEEFWKEMVSSSGLGDKVHAFEKLVGKRLDNPTHLNRGIEVIQKVTQGTISGIFNTGAQFLKTGFDVAKAIFPIAAVASISEVSSQENKPDSK